MNPITPRKRNSPVEEIINRLNNDYNLGIQCVADTTLTPHRRKELAESDEDFGRHDKIYRALNFLYWRKDDSLNQAEANFFIEAKAASSNWVPKAHADPDTLPWSKEPPRAATAGQQWALQTVLLEVLNRFMPPPNNTPGRTFGRTLSGPSGLSRPTPTNTKRNDEPANVTFADPPKRSLARSATGPPIHGAAIPLKFPDPVNTGSKRPSLESENLNQCTKRAKGKLSDNVAAAAAPPVPIASALDKVPTRRHANTRDPTATGQGRADQVDSFATSQGTSYGSSVFSACRHNQSITQSSFEAPPSQPREKRPVDATVFEAGNLIESPSKGRTTKPHIENQPLSSSSQGETSFSTYYESFPSSGGEGAIPEPSRSNGLARGEQSARSQVQVHAPVVAARLRNIWPKFPKWLHEAPLAVAWEVTRLFMHCKVDLEDESLGLKYDPSWSTARDVTDIWKTLYRLDAFRGKPFPEKPPNDVFATAMTGNFESKGSAVVLSAVLDYNPDNSPTAPLYLVKLKPLMFEQGCRLTRRFGPDRFFEILIPSPTSTSPSVPPVVSKQPGAVEEVIQWLTMGPHSLVGRQWRAFFAKDAGYRKPLREFQLRAEDPKPIIKERVHFFAETGITFRPDVFKTRSVVPAEEPVQQRTEFKVSQMLDWLLQLDNNTWQPHLKLFSRIQLGLSKTYAIMTLEPHQIRHHKSDLLSPSGTGEVMNDGVGRMSRSVAKRIRDVLGLGDVPSAVQGRFGSAKGMWVIDVDDTGDEDWIETYPSQRKWECDFVDKHQRTLEVRSVASELKSAGLNLQLLPVLEDRARDKVKMRQAIGDRLINDLQRQFTEQKHALNRPVEFRQWVYESYSSRATRVSHGRVPFLAGLPDSQEETLNFLMNSGFDPKKQKYLQDIAWDLQKRKCDTLKSKLNIRVGRSAYIYMIADFWGVLEENEVHVGFSSKFRDEEESFTLLSDCDVLVARSPAHFPSDIQRVRAVFKPELHSLKDVIIFSTKGDVPLAKKLSGGDYDGDMAWVCWDPEIVDGFVNAEMPLEPDLSRYLKKDKTTFKQLMASHGTGSAAKEQTTYDMIQKSFHFALQPNFLGMCTNYKERLCYINNSVSNKPAIILSSLVGNLVDQSKQGIVFNEASWAQLRRELLGGALSLPDPMYKSDSWLGRGEPTHIIDYLKFSIARPAIDKELEAFHNAMKAAKDTEDGAHFWDPDLASYYTFFKEISDKSRSSAQLFTTLKNRIGEVEKEYGRLVKNKEMRDSKDPYPVRVNQVYEKWCAITPEAMDKSGANYDSKVIRLLELSFLADREMNTWALLRASTAFKLYYHKSPKFVWQMAGRQLAYIKAQMTSRPGEGVPALMTAFMYAGLMPDKKFTKQYVARLEGDGSEYPDPEDYEVLGDDNFDGIGFTGNGDY
ncbi:RNA dependent RNA polymerase-domain-containing protein [Neurospora hispaniola]|uniref:RNA-dependent RNA polymerase n=1 Tax=Neurospora hispaniola TaxID=588809 RepID=A0AAJ0MSX2_9PEZI|nr:RNA dependent RNA polymerase-domain-containing protein [Neurospora hispaniola]